MNLTLTSTAKLWSFVSYFIAFYCVGNETDEWELWRSKYQVNVFEIKDEQNTISVRAETTVTGSVEAFMAVLENTDIATRWIANVRQITVVDSPSENERVVHTQFRSPWPLARRDMVTCSQFYQATNQTNNQHQLQVRSCHDKHPVVDKTLRVTNFQGDWFISEEGQDQISIIYRFSMTPVGDLPQWLNRSLLLNGTLRTFRNLRKELLNANEQPISKVKTSS